MKESDFENHVTSMVKERQATDLALEDEVLRNWYEVTTQEYVFDRQHREVSVVCTLQYKQVTVMVISCEFHAVTLSSLSYL